MTEDAGLRDDVRGKHAWYSDCIMSDAL